MAQVLLKDLVYARSGDKGDVSNIGIIARDDRAWAIIQREVTPERLKAHFGAWLQGEVEIYPLPNLQAMNLVLRGALGGGATRTLRYDQTGKAMATAVLRMPVEVD